MAQSSWFLAHTDGILGCPGWGLSNSGALRKWRKGCSIKELLKSISKLSIHNEQQNRVCSAPEQRHVGLNR